MAQYARSRLRAKFDWVLLLTVIALAVVGILNLRSASLTTDTSAHVTQLVWFVVGGVLCALVTAVDYRLLDRFAVPFYVLVLGLLLLVLIIGKEVNGARRWISIFTFTLQPSELMKLALVLVLARYFHRTRRSEGYSLRDLIVPALLLALPVVLIVKEPDLGTALMLVFIFLSLLFLERLKRRTRLVIVIGVALAGPMVWQFGLKDYQRERIETFLQPDRDRFNTGWQARQSQIAVGSGRFSGKGYMGSTQSFGRFLPETRTDFILATFAEEHGFLGCLVLLSLYFFLIAWALQIGFHARDRFGAITCVGVAAMLFWHVLVNMGMVIGLLPVVGVTLPLLSYGGSSVITVLMGVGLLLNVSMRRHSF
jgi:rod shape determining protein RodA